MKLTRYLHHSPTLRSSPSKNNTSETVFIQQSHRQQCLKDSWNWHKTSNDTISVLLVKRKEEQKDNRSWPFGHTLKKIWRHIWVNGRQVVNLANLLKTAHKLKQAVHELVKALGAFPWKCVWCHFHWGTHDLSWPPDFFVSLNGVGLLRNTKRV